MLNNIFSYILAGLFITFVLSFPFLVMFLIVLSQRLAGSVLGFELWPWNVVSGGIIGWLIYLFVGIGNIGDGA